MKLKGFILVGLVAILTSGCHKKHDTAVVPGVTPTSTTTTNRYQGVAVSSAVTTVDIYPFNAATDTFSVSRANGWSSIAIPNCPSANICYTMAGTIISLDNTAAGPFNYTITTVVKD